MRNCGMTGLSTHPPTNSSVSTSSACSVLLGIRKLQPYGSLHASGLLLDRRLVSDHLWVHLIVHARNMQIFRGFMGLVETAECVYALPSCSDFWFVLSSKPLKAIVIPSHVQFPITSNLQWTNCKCFGVLILSQCERV